MRWSDQSILVTGGTGSFGRAFIAAMLEKYKPRTLTVFSRDELKQHEMRKVFAEGKHGDTGLRYFIGDIRDRDRLHRAMHDIDIVVHAAALKHVSACEYNPFEAVQTNINGTRNIIDAALDTGVARVLGLSTDKAVNPVNLYGATKLVAEKLIIQGNAYVGGADKHFSCVRYGNVVGSSGSVVPLFHEQKKTGTLTITDERMTRFWLTLDEGVDIVVRAIETMQGGEIFVPKIPSMKVTDLADAMAPGTDRKFIGIRPGEKLHEVLLSRDEARHAIETENGFIIYPENPSWPVKKMKGKELKEDFQYASDENTEWLTGRQLQALL